MIPAMLITAIGKHWKDAVLVALLAALVAASLAAKVYRGDAVAASARAAIATAQAATFRKDAADNQAALVAEQTATASAAKADDQLRSEIDALPSSADCARSAALRHLLDGLHHHGVSGPPSRS